MPMNGTSILRQPSFRTGGNSSAQQLAFDTKYELLNTIGTGSSGVVRRVRERGGQRREFACKIIDKKKVRIEKGCLGFGCLLVLIRFCLFVL